MKRFLPYIVIAVIAFGLYARTGSFGWLTTEDANYVHGNPFITGQAPETGAPTIGPIRGFAWCVRTFHFQQWIPVSLCTHKLTTLVFGTNPGPHHLLNTLLHVAISVLVFELLRRLTGLSLPSVLGACMFAAHPQHVQLVAWISELKDLLSYLFATLSLLAYLKHLDRPAGQTGSPFLRFALVFFALGLASRFIISGLPLIFLTLHLYRDRKPRWRELAPFVFLALGFTIFTAYLSFPQRARFNLNELSLAQQILPIATNFFEYFRKTCIVSPLPFFNVFPRTQPLYVGASALVAIVAISLFTWKSRKRFPELALAWFWHLAALAPVCGIITLGPNFYSDHYSYLPHIPLFTAVCIALSRVIPRTALIGVGTLITIGLAILTWRQTTPFRNTLTCMIHESTIQPSPIIQRSLAHDILKDGDPEAALAALQRSLTLPESSHAPGLEDTLDQLATQIDPNGKLTPDAIQTLRRIIGSPKAEVKN